MYNQASLSINIWTGVAGAGRVILCETSMPQEFSIFDGLPAQRMSHTMKRQTSAWSRVPSFRHSRYQLIMRIWLLLATGLGNQPAVGDQTANRVQFSFKATQKLHTLHLEGPNTDPYSSTQGFCRICPDQSVPIFASGFHVFFCLDTYTCRLLVAKSGQWDIIVHFGGIGWLYDQKQIRNNGDPFWKWESTAGQWFLVLYLG
jgi:hypothetical protein